jgi:hypothetical protein
LPTRRRPSGSSLGSDASAAERLIADAVSTEIEAAREERDQAVRDFGVAAAQAVLMASRLDELVDWLVRTGYPSDWLSTEKPPEWMIPALVSALARQWGEKDTALVEWAVRTELGEDLPMPDPTSDLSAPLVKPAVDLSLSALQVAASAVSAAQKGTGDPA